MDITQILVGWGFLMVVILVIGLLIRRADRLNQYPDKLDFVEWYTQNKEDVLNNVERRAKMFDLDLESEIDKEYEAYLQS